MRNITGKGIYVGYRYFDSYDVEPRYPFGYGLSYTTFAIEKENVELVGTKVMVRANVTNTGPTYSGKEVVQLYAAVRRPEWPKNTSDWRRLPRPA